MGMWRLEREGLSDSLYVFMEQICVGMNSWSGWSGLWTRQRGNLSEYMEYIQCTIHGIGRFVTLLFLSRVSYVNRDLRMTFRSLDSTFQRCFIFIFFH